MESCWNILGIERDVLHPSHETLGRDELFSKIPDVVDRFLNKKIIALFQLGEFSPKYCSTLEVQHCSVEFTANQILKKSGTPYLQLSPDETSFTTQTIFRNIFSKSWGIQTSFWIYSEVVIHIQHNIIDN